MAISIFHFFLFFFFLLILIPNYGVGQDECKVSRCSDYGPAIRFPFWLKTIQPEHCGYPGFRLSCNQKKQTVLELPSSVEVIVKRIHYKSQSIIISDPKRCLPAQLPSLNLSASPFQFVGNELPYNTFSLFNCSPPNRNLPFLVPCLSVHGYHVYAIYDSYSIRSYQSISCVKTYNISSVPPYIFEADHQNNLQLAWLEPNCTTCEAQNKMCRSKNYTAREVEVQCLPKTAKGEAKKLFVTGLVLGIFLAVLGLSAIYRVYISYKTQKEDQVKIVKFLEDYKALKPTRYSFGDIRKITNDFKDKLGEGGYGTVFRGKLSSEIAVAVKLLSSSIGNGEDFINEVGTMSRIHHVNVVRLVGFCADGIRRALVYDFLPNGSLEKYIFSENQRNSLGWMTLRDIALGIAEGIEYLHQGCDQQILHFDIKPHNVLLDQNFNPKISDFGLAKLCSKEQSVVSVSAARGTVGYIAPELFSRNFGNVSYKSDVYSFGMLLLEMVGGRKNNDTNLPNTSQTYFPEWAYNRLSQGEELRMRNIEEDEHSNIAKQLTITGLWCIQWYPVDRPSMKTVVQMLEGNGNIVTVPPNPFASADRSTRPAGALNTELEVICEAE